MRILVVTQYFWPEVFRVNELIAELVARGHAVTVLTGFPNYPDGDVFPEYRRRPEDFARYQGADIIRVPMLSRGRGRGGRLLLNYLTFALSAALLGPWKLRRRRFDVIFAYEPSPITVGIPAAVLRRLKRAPLALWVLDLWPETLRAIGVLRSESLLSVVGALVAWIYRHCDLILAQSRSFITDIASRAPEVKDIVYFPAWADRVFATLQKVVPASEVPVMPEGSFRIMFAGNIGEAQDFPAILNAAEALRHRQDVQWIIVGDGRMGSWLRAEVARRGLDMQFHLVGRHSLERMPEFFAHADAMLLSLQPKPIFSMTIPGKLQAYLGAGLPVLAMIDGEGADVVRQADAGLVCAAGDSEGLARIIAEMADMSAEERSEMGQRGRDYSEREFNFHSQVSVLEDHLVSLSKKARGNSIR